MATGDWLPAGKSTAVVVTIDDIHPGTSDDAYEAGGDLGEGALGHVAALLEAWPQLVVTLFTTPDWRQISPFPTNDGDVMLEPGFHAPILPKGTMALHNHPQFSDYLNANERMQVAVHGLHHIHPGPNIPVEFQLQDVATCESMLREALEIFEEANVDVSPGFQPPAWNLPTALSTALVNVGFKWVAGARDILTEISADAVSNMRGPKGLSLIHPQKLAGGLVHFTSNFQATSEFDRAYHIAEAGGVIAVKCHIVKNALGHVALDGVDETYMERLDALFRALTARFSDTVWWTTMDEISTTVAAHDR